MSSIAHPAGWLKTAQRHRTTGKESSCAQLPCEGNIKNYGINKVEDKVNYTPSLRAVPIRRLSAVRSSLGVRWSHIILNPFGILVLLPYYKT